MTILIYLALIVALSLACTAGLHFFYRIFVRAINHFDAKRFKQLPRTKEFVVSDAKPGWCGGGGLDYLDYRDQQKGDHANDDVWPEIVDI